jgi:hypothetical protein
MHKLLAEQISPTTGAAPLPPCCGTGCAVCVLDYADEQYAVGAPPTPAVEAGAPAAPANERTQCCNTGCLVCVRDYPELLLPTSAETQVLQLLQAVEEAQLHAAQLCAQAKGEQR